MTVSINPLDIIKAFNERGIRKRENIADYLDVIANVATALAKEWSVIYEKYGFKKVPTSRLLISQRPLFFEAFHHYKRASTVLSNKLSQTEMKELFDSLGSLLAKRNDLKRLFDLASTALFQREWPTDFSPNQIEHNIEVMQDNAASLRVLAAAIRARG